MAYGTKVIFEPVREIAAASIGASYSAVGTGTIGHSRIINFKNGTNQDVYVSFDGVTNHLHVFSNSFELFDFTTNKVSNDGFFLDLGTIFYVKQFSSPPTTGTFVIEVAYAIGGV